MAQDKATGELKGDGTVSYEDPFSAGSAVEWFNGKDYKGVSPTSIRPSASFGRACPQKYACMSRILQMHA